LLQRKLAPKFTIGGFEFLMPCRHTHGKTSFTVCALLRCTRVAPLYEAPTVIYLSHILTEPMKGSCQQD